MTRDLPGWDADGANRWKKCARRRACFAVSATLVGTILLFAGGLRARAADAASPTIVSAALAPATATVGDRLTLTIVVDASPGTTIESAGFAADAGGPEVVDVQAPRTEPHGAVQRTTLVSTLVAFQTGAITVPPQRVTYRGADGDGELESEPLRVSINSVLAPGDEGLRPLKPQIDLGDSAPPAVVPALLVAAFAALTAFGYALHRRVSTLPAPVAYAVPVGAAPLPAATADEALDAIAVSGLSETDVGEYYAQIAATVRSYLSERFSFSAYAMTRSEVERAMTAHGIEQWPAHLTANLLAQCEAAEFAAFRPASQRRVADLVTAREIIALTDR